MPALRVLDLGYSIRLMPTPLPELREFLFSFVIGTQWTDWARVLCGLPKLEVLGISIHRAFLAETTPQQSEEVVLPSLKHLKLVGVPNHDLILGHLLVQLTAPGLEDVTLCDCGTVAGRWICEVLVSIILVAIKRCLSFCKARQVPNLRSLSAPKNFVGSWAVSSALGDEPLILPQLEEFGVYLERDPRGTYLMHELVQDVVRVRKGVIKKISVSGDDKLISFLKDNVASVVVSLS
jgi:hypothetical protein